MEINKNHYKSKEVIFGMIPAKNSNMRVFLPVQSISNLVVLFTFDAICHQIIFLRGFQAARHFILAFVASPNNEPWQSISEKKGKNMLSGYFQFLDVLAFHKLKAAL